MTVAPTTERTAKKKKNMAMRLMTVPRAQPDRGGYASFSGHQDGRSE